MGQRGSAQVGLPMGKKFHLVLATIIDIAILLYGLKRSVENITQEFR